MNTQKTARISKKSNPSTNALVKTKNVACEDIKHSPWLEDYLDLFTFKLKPVNQAFIDRLSVELIQWVDDKKEARQRMKISQFYGMKKIPKKTYDRWVEKHPTLAAANEYAVMTLGDRREVGVAIRDYDSSVLRMMWKYDPDWKYAEEWRSSLKDQTTTGNVTINLPNITTTPTIEE